MAVKDRLLDVFLSEEGVTSVDEEITQLRGMGIDEAESKGAQTSYHVELLRRYLELLKRDREHLLDPRQRRKIRRLLDRAGAAVDPDPMFITGISLAILIVPTVVMVLVAGVLPNDQRPTIYIIFGTAIAVALALGFVILMRMPTRYHRRQLEAVLELDAILPDRSGPASQTSL